MPANSAAWLEAKDTPLVVKEAEYTKPAADELTIKNHAVAINPVDHFSYASGLFVPSFPFVLGCDAAGEVVEVGSEVKKFKVGDRVLAHPLGIATGQASNAAFQNYVNVPAVLSSPIPKDMAFKDACVLPLATSTAAAGLYELDSLNLTPPKIGADRKNDVVLVWSGSSSVGSCAIQLATASGYTVVTTCSKRNFDYVRDLGAAHAIDYNSSTVVDDIIGAMANSKLVGIYDAFGDENSLKLCAQVAHKARGSNNIACVKPGADQGAPAGVRVKAIFAVSVKDNEVGPAIYKDFLPQALEKGLYRPKPEPKVVGKGLEKIQDGIMAIKDGVSATKLVVEL